MLKTLYVYNSQELLQSLFKVTWGVSLPLHSFCHRRLSISQLWALGGVSGLQILREGTPALRSQSLIGAGADTKSCHEDILCAWLKIKFTRAFKACYKNIMEEKVWRNIWLNQAKISSKYFSPPRLMWKSWTVK